MIARANTYNRHRLNINSLALSAMLVFCLFILSVQGVAFAVEQEIQLTEHGHPDLQGVWNFSTSTPLERDPILAEKEFFSAEEVASMKADREASWQSFLVAEESIAERLSQAASVGSVNLFWAELAPLRENRRTSLIVYPRDGRIPPVQPGVQVQRSDWLGVTEIPGDRPVRYTHGGIARNGPEDRGLSERCLVFNSGPPLRSGPYNNNIQIFQNSDHVVILTEMGFDARIVPLEKAEHISAEITQWSGDSRGYFDGSTLVVETRNFSDKIASLGMQAIAYGSARNRLLIERFTPTGEGMLDYEFTIDDPDTFSDKIIAIIPMTKSDSRIYEYACHAGNYALAKILSSAGHGK